MEKRVNVARFSIVQGEWRQDAPELRVMIGGPSRRDRGTLYLLIEAPLQRRFSPALYDQLAEAVRDTYFGLQGSVTRGVRAGLMRANELLYERNRRTPREQRVVVGLNCMVLRGQDAYVGQLGPALVSHLQGDYDQIRRYPAESVWFNKTAPGALEMNSDPPAGLRQDAEPDLFYTRFGPDDTLIVATSTLAALFSERPLLRLLSEREGDDMRQDLADLTRNSYLSAMVMRWGAERARPEARVEETVVDRQERAVPEPEPPAQTPEERAHEAPGPSQPTRVEEQQTEPMPEEAYAEEEAPPAGPRRREARDRRQAEAAAAAKADDQAVAPSSGGGGPDLSGVREAVGRGAEAVGRGAEKVRRATEDALLQVLPEESPERPPEKALSRQPISMSGRALIVVSLIIPLVVLFIVVMARIQYNRTSSDQYGALLSRAQARFESAITQEDVTLKRQGLYDTLAAVEEGLAINPNDEDLASLRQRAIHHVDDIDDVRRLPYFTKLYYFPDGRVSSGDSSRIVMHDKDVFVLNRGTDRVYKFFLNDVGDALQSVDSEPVLVQGGDTVGGLQIGELVDAAWVAEEANSEVGRFLVLERSGSLISYDRQTGLEVMPVADSDVWQKPEAIGGFYGNLYVLDPLLGRIFKYLPLNGEYAQSPVDCLDPNAGIDLTGAVDMAIDGNLYVLYADGRVKKFFDGEEQVFTLNGLPSPMQNPTCIFVSGPKEPEAEGRVYVVDTGNSRVLQFTKDGVYLQQFKAAIGDDSMDALRGIYVVEEENRLFLLNGHDLLLSHMPAARG